MTYAYPNKSRAIAAGRFNSPDSPAGRARIDGIGAYYPRSRPVGIGDICACSTCLRPGGLGAVPASTQVESSIGTSLLTAVPFTGPAAPFVAVAGLVAHFLAVMGVGSGCGETCVLSSQYADRAEALLQQNLDTYFALPVPRDPTAQAAALRVFDAIWADLVQACGNPALGDAGKRCISDRQAGACVWRQDKNSPYPDVPAMGECWNWVSGYRDPIANDRAVGVTPMPVLTSGDSDASVAGLPSAPAAGGPNYLLLAGLLVGAAVLAGVN